MQKKQPEGLRLTNPAGFRPASDRATLIIASVQLYLRVIARHVPFVSLNVSRCLTAPSFCAVCNILLQYATLTLRASPPGSASERTDLLFSRRGVGREGALTFAPRSLVSASTHTPWGAYKTKPVPAVMAMSPRVALRHSLATALKAEPTTDCADRLSSERSLCEICGICDLIPVPSVSIRGC